MRTGDEREEKLYHGVGLDQISGCECAELNSGVGFKHYWTEREKGI